jgi:hypothetical protein
LEFLALLVTVWKLFYNYDEWIRQLPATIPKKRKKKEGTLILILFSIGMVLQIIALFL